MNHRLKDTDRCVMCGLCLPHCPTYGLSRQEGDSPRGRISLMQGLASGRLEADDRVSAHLDGCLECRACESVCPSGVPFGRLMDEARALLREQRPDRPALPGVARPMLRGGATGRFMAGLLHTGQRLGLAGVAGRLPGLAGKPLGRALALLPAKATPATPRGIHTPAGDCLGTVQLFTGCTGNAFEGRALAAARDLLLALGYRVEVPPTQGCCGALDLHAGKPEATRRLAAGNLAAFAASDAPIISLNSGCRTQLREYAALIPEGAALAGRVRDLYGFLMEHEDRLFGEEGLVRPKPPEHRTRRVAVHLACTLRNVLREQGAMLALLRRLPGLEVVELEGNDRCCGAAGAHMFTHPEAADALLSPKIEAARRQAPEAIITANIGCSLHFQAGLRRAGLEVPVMTPAEWLVSQWQVSSG